MVTSTIRSRVHFFPSAGTTAGHYPVSCELTLFGRGIERRAVKLEGGRLNQPDGIRLEDAFPALDHESSGLCGLEVVFECEQGRINLTNSRLVIEIVSPQFSLAYGAAPFVPNDVAVSESGDVHQDGSARDSGVVGVGIQDGRITPSLVIVNPTDELLRPEFKHSTRDGQAPLQLGTVAAGSAVEFPLDEAMFKNAPVHELLSGAAVIEKLWGDANWAHSSLGHTSAACYILQRESVSKRPVSVYAL
jgi:hypothetical protein